MRKEQRKLARRKAWREGLPATLVVCEGRETEPNYILGLCEHLHVNTAAVTVMRGETVTDASPNGGDAGLEPATNGLKTGDSGDPGTPNVDESDD